MLSRIAADFDLRRMMEGEKIRVNLFRRLALFLSPSFFPSFFLFSCFVCRPFHHFSVHAGMLTVLSCDTTEGISVEKDNVNAGSSLCKKEQFRASVRCWKSLIAMDMRDSMTCLAD